MSSHGFTLLEMLVVMVLLGLLSTLVLPQMQRWHDAVQARAQGAALLDELRAAAFAAGARRVTLRLEVASFEPATTASSQAAARVLSVRLPPNWVLREMEPAAFLASGLCEPGGARLLTDRGVPVRLSVAGPRCEVRLEPDASGGAG